MGSITNILETNIKYLSSSFYNNKAIQKLLGYKNSGQNRYELAKNKNNEHYLTYENKPITSSYATEKEAARLIENSMTQSKSSDSIAIFLSCSYPAHIRYFAENYKHKTIFIIEKDISLVHLILTTIDCSFLSKTILLIDESESAASSVIDNMLEDIDVKKVCVSAHPRATVVNDIVKNYYTSLLTSINEVLKKKIMSLATYYYHAPLWSKNILNNILHNGGYSITSILNIAKNNADIPVLIISAGCTIDSEVQNIKRLCESHFTLVLSNALGFATENDIKIDAVISTDGGFYASYHYMALEYAARKNINIITTYTSYSHANSRFDKENIFYFSHNELFERHFCKDSYYIPMEGSVIIVALKIASLLASSEIVVAGADFSFTDEKTHSKHSMSFKTDFSLQDRLNSLYSLNENRQGNDKTYVQDYNGQQKTTSFSLYEYYRHFEYAVANIDPSIKIYSLTAHSAKIDGISLYQMKASYKKLDYTIERVRENIDCEYVKSEMSKYYSTLEQGSFEAILEHSYTMLIAPWHVENYIKNKTDEARDELLLYLKNWRID